jgi:RHS repeat-associated protein
VHSYKWDAENRLIEIDYAGSISKTKFSYDGMGHRLVDVENTGLTGTTRYLWCGAVICQNRSSTDTVLKRFLGEGEYTVSSGQQLVYMPDQLGSVRDVLNAGTGALTQSYDFTPYGSVARSTGSTPTGYQYASLFAHPQSGLNLSVTRPQDGITGRWLNKDPIREVGGFNLYTYVQANSIKYTDPSGQDWRKTLQALACIGSLTCWHLDNPQADVANYQNNPTSGEAAADAVSSGEVCPEPQAVTQGPPQTPGPPAPPTSPVVPLLMTTPPSLPWFYIEAPGVLHWLNSLFGGGGSGAV